MPSPDTSSEIRRLAVIMFTDMVGYSALTQRDEALALELLEEHRGLIRAILPKYYGHEIKTTGDGFLLEFSSALAAAECAAEIQQAFAERNRAKPPERRIQIRIGIHIGDVVQRDGDVYGDGVNIAARIEPLAEPGGICLTNAVYEQIVNKVQYALVALPRPRLKNIETPVQIYKLVRDGPGTETAKRPPRTNGGRISAAPGRFPLFAALGTLFLAALGIVLFLKFGGKSNVSASATPTPQLSAPSPSNIAEEKSVAVLPFVNMSSDKENEYLSDGITEELLNSLARIPGLHVPARTSSFVFKGKNEDIRKIGGLLNVGTVLEGSVRRSGNRLRITAELINVSDGYRLWSDSFDRDMKDVFAVQEEIARTIVGKLKVRLTGKVGQSLVKQDTENIEAWQLYLKGQYSLYQYTEEGFHQAISYYKEAIKKQPDYAKAYAGIANAYDNLSFLGHVSPQITRPLQSAAIAKALELDDTLAEAHTSLGSLKWTQWDWPAAERSFKYAIELAPANANAYTLYADFLSSQNRIQEAAAENVIVRWLDPIGPDNDMLGSSILFREGKHDQAIDIVRRMVVIDPNSWWPREHLADYLFRTGKRAEGIAEMEIAARLEKGPWTLARLGRMYGQVGRKKDAQAVLQKLLDLRKTRYVAPHWIALVYEGLGEYEQANVWMNQAIEERQPFLVYLKMFTDDTNRANPYFPEWLKKIGFDAAKQ